MERAPELEDLMRRWYAAMADGDAAFVDRALSRQEGLLVIGSDPREWWTGYATAAERFKTQIREMGGQLRATPGDLQAYREGSVGWAADHPTFRLPDGTELALRLTGVFRQEDGEWRCVQWHASIGVGNEEAVGKELTV
jgi:ketosteroid isomerase-like protein